MKKEICPSNVRLVFSIGIVFISLICCYMFNYNKTYKSIEVKTKKVAMVEYGSKKYNINDLIDTDDSSSVRVVKDVDSKKIGNQKLVVCVNKDGVNKDVSINVEVKDTTAPEIKIKDETVSLNAGDNFDVFNNLDSVYDKVDGVIDYQQKEIVNYDVDTNYYTIDGNVDTNVSGVYPVVISAVDKYGNKSSVTYNVVVEDKVQEEVVDDSSNNNSSNAVINYQNDYTPVADVNGLVNLAYSLIGSPYVAGGTTPSGFDCSGFVQYLYSMMGVNISRSTSTQIHDGVAVSYDNAQPGDILSWGYVDGVPTHSAIYVGNGQMIHATNPRQGVILSDVAAWTRGSGTRVIAVRRI